VATIGGIRACVFDAYGTLFDVHSAVGRHRERMGEAAPAVSALWRQKQLEYTWLRSLMRRHADFWQVTGDALDYALASHGIDDPALRADLMDAYLRLDCYPEVPMVLEQLNRAGLRCAILSNGSPAMLDAAVASAGLGEWLEGVLSIEDVGIYKPDPRVYRLAVDRLGVSADQVCFLSSNAWDVAGALSFGFRVAWINRFGQPPERLGRTADAELRTLAKLPPLLGV
jgi:2-haloacid dehalogenase